MACKMADCHLLLKHLGKTYKVLPIRFGTESKIPTAWTALAAREQLALTVIFMGGLLLQGSVSLPTSNTGVAVALRDTGGSNWQMSIKFSNS